MKDRTREERVQEQKAQDHAGPEVGGDGREETKVVLS
jgi:hypothetical protein